jgi:hypothetical protein
MLETRDVCVVSHMVCCCPLHTRATSSVNRIRKPRTPAYQFYLSKNETRRLRAPGEFSGSVEPHHLGVMVPPRGRGFSTRLCSIVKDACSKEFLREHTSDSLVMPSFLWILTTLATKSENSLFLLGSQQCWREFCCWQNKIATTITLTQAEITRHARVILSAPYMVRICR